MVFLRHTCFALALALLSTAPARGQGASGGERVRVDYSAPGGCPNQPAFEAALAEHLGTATFARLDELARTLSVAVEAGPEGFRAKVELVDRQGRVAERSISAPSCEQAVQTIALVGALAVRSQAEQAEGALLDPPLIAPAPPVVAAPRATPVPPKKPPPPSPRVERRLTVETSAGVGLATGVGPVVAPGLLLLGRLGVSGVPERSLVVSVLAHDTFRASLEAADVRFTLLRARLELCPVEPRLSRAIILSPCAGFELGSQTGRSYEDEERVATSGEASRLWVAATLATRFRLSLGRARLGLGPELVVPLRRNRFALTQPERPVYEEPALAVAVSATGGLVW